METACRNVKFCPYHMDLMAVAHNLNDVTVIDARRWDALVKLNVASQCSSIAATTTTTTSTGGVAAAAGGGGLGGSGLGGAGHYGVVQRPVCDQNIPGLVFTHDGRKLLVALQNCVAEYRVKTMARRCFGSGSIR